MVRCHRDLRHALDLRHQSEEPRAQFRAERFYELARRVQFGVRR